MKRLAILLSASLTSAERGTAMELSSNAFQNNKAIPAVHSFRGGNQSPPLEIAAVPAETKSLALICDDPDAPHGPWIHWVVWNIDPKTTRIDKGTLPSGATVGLNSWSKSEWDGPAPPSGTHHYVFKLYALKEPLALKQATTDAKALEKAMQGKILAEAKLIGLYSAGK